VGVCGCEGTVGFINNLHEMASGCVIY